MDFKAEKIRVLCEKLADLKTEVIGYIDGFEYAPCEYKGNANIPDESAVFEKFEKGGRISGKDKHFWFKNKIKTPAKENGKELFFRLTTGHEGEWDAANPQGLIYLNGQIVQGLDTNHTTVPLESDTEYDIMIYFYTGMNGGYFDIIPELIIEDIKINDIYYDIHVPYDAMKCFDEDSDNYITIIKYLDEAVKKINFLVPKSPEFYKSIDEASAYMKDVFYGKICGKSEQTVNCIGHTHIDVAWLWTVAQTREKAQRSFATVLNLMKKYPEYKFMSTQPQLFEFVKNDAPELYERIKTAVKEKRFELEGSMWLEADCNITSGESLVRQILFGKRFFKNEFGVDNKSVWLPDVFGYSAAMPQIMKKSGVEYFVTSKISWSESNTMPHDSFMWQGIDGSEIFTYFMTAQDLPADGKPVNYTTYVGYIRPSQVLGSWKRYHDKKYCNESLITFGFGDGGGGPTADMLEQQRRLAHGIPGIPKTTIDFSRNFINRVRHSFDEYCKTSGYTPKWVGELYLEMHRGTYTSIAKNKRNNRKSEIMYQKAEAVSVLDNLLYGTKYPQEEINSAWKTILLNQFHDIIPGSSIFEVYETTDKEYAKIMECGNNIINEKTSRIAADVKTGGGIFVYNPNAFECSTVINLGNEKIYAENVPALGYKVISEFNANTGITFENGVVNTPFYEVCFDENANISSIYDKENGREINSGVFNEFEVYEDFPREYDAWEITDYYKDKVYKLGKPESISGEKCSSAYCITVTRKFLSSEITQKIYFYEDIRRIDFDTEIDWKQEHQMMKIAFPVNVHATEATYDIQFGSIKRPTHENTSWDKAKFEVCAHKWADISEDDYGVSILNDCKYGYNAEGNTIKLTVLKSATYPNPAADKELHRFSYSVFPHSGSFKSAGTVKEAYVFNNPLTAVAISAQDGSLPEAYSLVKADKENIIIETVKKAEDSDDIVIRLYDAFDRKTSVHLDFGFEFESAYICDMLENDEEKISDGGNALNINVSNFEIVTIKLKGAII